MKRPLHPPPTERLRFDTWTESDGALAISLWTHPEVMRHMGGAMTEAGALERMRREIDRQQRYGIQYWPIFLREAGLRETDPCEAELRANARFAGCCGLRPFHEDATIFELGVHLARPCWSLRLGEEAARAVIDFAFTVLDASLLVAGHGPENANSQALIERLGFIYSHHSPWGEQQILHPIYRLEPVRQV